MKRLTSLYHGACLEPLSQAYLTLCRRWLYPCTKNRQVVHSKLHRPRRLVSIWLLLNLLVPLPVTMVLFTSTLHDTKTSMLTPMQALKPLSMLSGVSYHLCKSMGHRPRIPAVLPSGVKGHLTGYGLTLYPTTTGISTITLCYR